MRGGSPAAEQAGARAPDGARRYRRADRPEIVELTGQKRVPVLIAGDQVVHDSKRILEYLEWKSRTDVPARA